MNDPLSLRRGEMARALLRLTAPDVLVLIALSLAADPVTARLTLVREDLAVRLAVPLDRIQRAIDRLVRHGFVARIGVEGDAELLELVHVLHRVGQPPAHLPFEPMML